MICKQFPLAPVRIVTTRKVCPAAYIFTIPIFWKCSMVRDSEGKDSTLGYRCGKYILCMSDWIDAYWNNKDYSLFFVIAADK